MNWLELLLTVFPIMGFQLGFADGDGGDDSKGSNETQEPEAWRTQIPEAIRGEKVFENVQGVGDMATQFLNSQKLVGVDRIAKPQENWTAEQWGEFHESAGRPKSAADYPKLSDEQAKGITLDESSLSAANGRLHELGLSTAQATGVMGLYHETLAGLSEAEEEAARTEQAVSVTRLKDMFKEDFDSNISIARSVISKFGNEEFGTFLDESRLGDNPAFVEAMVKIGKSMLEDTAQGSGGGNLDISSEASAKEEIATLRLDTEFMIKLNNRDVAGHTEAVARWTELHRKSYPGVQEDQG